MNKRCVGFLVQKNLITKKKNKSIFRFTFATYHFAIIADIAVAIDGIMDSNVDTMSTMGDENWRIEIIFCCKKFSDSFAVYWRGSLYTREHVSTHSSEANSWQAECSRKEITNFLFWNEQMSDDKWWEKKKKNWKTVARELHDSTHANPIIISSHYQSNVWSFSHLTLSICAFLFLFLSAHSMWESE